VPFSADEARRRLCALGDHVRARVAGAGGTDMARVAGETAADTIYAIDRVADDALLGWFERPLPLPTSISEPVLGGGRAPAGATARSMEKP